MISCKTFQPLCRLQYWRLLLETANLRSMSAQMRDFEDDDEEAELGEYEEGLDDDYDDDEDEEYDEELDLLGDEEVEGTNKSVTLHAS